MPEIHPFIMDLLQMTLIVLAIAGLTTLVVTLILAAIIQED